MNIVRLSIRLYMTAVFGGSLFSAKTFKNIQKQISGKKTTERTGNLIKGGRSVFPSASLYAVFAFSQNDQITRHIVKKKFQNRVVARVATLR